MMISRSGFNILRKVPLNCSRLLRHSSRAPAGGGYKGEEGKAHYINICHYCPCDSRSPTMYDSRKYGHCIPADNVMTPFEPLPCIPTGIFRCTDCERLGPCGTGKCGCYQNPEYFSYHHMSFLDINWALGPCRLPAPVTKRKP